MMLDIKNLSKLKKKNDIVIKSLYVFIVVSFFLILVHLLIHIEFFLFITQILLVVSLILFLYAKKINIEVNKMCNEVIGEKHDP